MPDAFALPTDLADRIQSRLTFLYGPERAPAVMDALVQRLAAFMPPPTPEGERLSERDVILITYGDIVRRAGRPRCAPCTTRSRARSRGRSTPSTSCPSSPTRPTTAFRSSTTPPLTLTSATGTTSRGCAATSA
ncbi:MAG: hypothetical protein M5R40_16730 [Anaerolineae bacterium]|nr:hypothetical protein [Anaerolineae bacterium]